jgi:hypothetical protein
LEARKAAWVDPSGRVVQLANKVIRHCQTEVPHQFDLPLIKPLEQVNSEEASAITNAADMLLADLTGILSIYLSIYLFI